MSQKERARQIVGEMKDLLWEFERILRSQGNAAIFDAFKAYPKGHISMALSDEHDYAGRTPHNLDQLAESLPSVDDDSCRHCGEEGEMTGHQTCQYPQDCA